MAKSNHGQRGFLPRWHGEDAALLQLARRARGRAHGICEVVPNVVVNGEATALPAGATVLNLLETLRLSATDVAVERNAEIVPRATFADAQLNEGDTLQIVTFVGGG